jgi:hypothetical protein
MSDTISVKSHSSRASNKSRTSHTSRKSSKASKIDADHMTQNVIEAFVTAIVDDFYNVSFEFAAKTQNKLSPVENYKEVVKKKIEGLINSQSVIDVLIAKAHERYQKATGSYMNNEEFYSRYTEYLVPDAQSGLNLNSKIKLIRLSVQFVMEKMQEYILANMQLIFNNTKDSRVHDRCTTELCKKCLSIIMDFKLIQLPAYKAEINGRTPATTDMYKKALAGLMADNAELKLQLEDSESRNAELEGEKQVLLQRLADAYNNMHATQTVTYQPPASMPMSTYRSTPLAPTPAPAPVDPFVIPTISSTPAAPQTHAVTNNYYGTQTSQNPSNNTSTAKVPTPAPSVLGADYINVKPASASVHDLKEDDDDNAIIEI